LRNSAVVIHFGILKRGTMLDATLIEAAAAPGTGGRGTPARPSRDPDAAFGGARKKGGFTFGYKAHVGVDEGSGLIRTVITTPAKVNDTTPADGTGPPCGGRSRVADGAGTSPVAAGCGRRRRGGQRFVNPNDV
jgi:hypothetical protein